MRLLFQRFDSLLKVGRNGKARSPSKLGPLGKMLGLGCLSIRLAIERAKGIKFPDADSYHKVLIEAYDPRDKTFGTRWSKLKEEMIRFRTSAMERSDSPPLFMIIPLMEDFDGYPLDRVHKNLAQMAEAVGFEVLDLLPEFRKILKDGS